jgi:hypothetical protein
MPASSRICHVSTSVPPTCPNLSGSPRPFPVNPRHPEATSRQMQFDKFFPNIQVSARGHALYSCNRHDCTTSNSETPCCALLLELMQTPMETEMLAHSFARYARMANDDEELSVFQAVPPSGPPADASRYLLHRVVPKIVKHDKYSNTIGASTSIPLAALPKWWNVSGSALSASQHGHKARSHGYGWLFSNHLLVMLSPLHRVCVLLFVCTQVIITTLQGQSVPATIVTRVLQCGGHEQRSSLPRAQTPAQGERPAGDFAHDAASMPSANATTVSKHRFRQIQQQQVRTQHQAWTAVTKNCPVLCTA